MSSQPPVDEEPRNHVSSAFLAQNVAFNGTQQELEKIVAAGPWGAAALAGAAVALLLAIWLAFFVLVFLPRGASG